MICLPQEGRPLLEFQQLLWLALCALSRAVISPTLNDAWFGVWLILTACREFVWKGCLGRDSDFALVLNLLSVSAGIISFYVKSNLITGCIASSSRK